jgi:hypothetical protein
MGNGAKAAEARARKKDTKKGSTSQLKTVCLLSRLRRNGLRLPSAFPVAPLRSLPDGGGDS